MLVRRTASNLIMVYILNVRTAYSETSISTVYHYEKVLKASDIVWFVSTSAVILSSVLSGAPVGCL